MISVIMYTHNDVSEVVVVGDRNLNCTDVKLRIGVPALPPQPLSAADTSSDNGDRSRAAAPLAATGNCQRSGCTDSSVVCRTVRRWAAGDCWDTVTLTDTTLIGDGGDETAAAAAAAAAEAGLVVFDDVLCDVCKGGRGAVRCGRCGVKKAGAPALGGRLSVLGLCGTGGRNGCSVFAGVSLWSVCGDLVAVLEVNTDLVSKVCKKPLQTKCKQTHTLNL